MRVAAVMWAMPFLSRIISTGPDGAGVTVSRPRTSGMGLALNGTHEEMIAERTNDPRTASAKRLKTEIAEDFTKDPSKINGTGRLGG